MSNTRQSRFEAAATAIGHDFSGALQIGGNYTSTVQHGDQVFVSGQVPRIGSTVVVTGRVGSEVSLADAQHAARVCAMRALALLAQHCGSLDRVRQLLKVGVYTQSAPDFTQQSEVADAASALLHEVLGEAGRHTRTSLGVYQLPKNASVELDLVAAVEP